MEVWANVEVVAAAEVSGFVSVGFVVDDDVADDGYKEGGILVEWDIEVYSS